MSSFNKLRKTQLEPPVFIGLAVLEASIIAALLVLAAGSPFVKNNVNQWLARHSNLAYAIGVVPANSAQIDLVTGWNMVGIPADVESVKVNGDDFGGCTISSGPWFWDGSDYALTDDLMTGRGYWIKVDQDCTASIATDSSVQFQELTDLQAGWNMISSNKAWDEIRGDCAAKKDTLFLWQDDLGDYLSITPATTLEENKSYFVFVENSCTLGEPTNGGGTGPLGDFLSDLCRMAADGVSLGLSDVVSAVTPVAITSLSPTDIIKDGIGGAVAEQLKIVSQFSVWLEDTKGINIEDVLAGTSPQPLDQLILEFVANPGTIITVAFDVPQVKSVLTDFFAGLGVDPQLAQETVDFIEFVMASNNWDVAQVLAMDADQFKNLLLAYAQQKGVAFFANLTELNELITRLQGFGLTSENFEQIANFVYWLMTSKGMSVTAVAQLDIGDIATLKAEYNSSGVSVQLTLNEQDIDIFITDVALKLIEQAGLDKQYIKEISSFLAFLKQQGISLQQIPTLDAVEFQSFLAAYVEANGTTLLQLTLNIFLDPITAEVQQISQSLGINPDLLNEIIAFINFIVDKDGVDVNVVINYSVDQLTTLLTQYASSTISGEVSKLTGIPEQYIRALLEAIVNNRDAILDKALNLDIAGIFNSLIDIQVNGNLNCPIANLVTGDPSFICEAIDQKNWRPPLIDQANTISQGSDPNDVLVYLSLGKQGRPAQFKVCDVPNVSVFIKSNPPFPIFSGLALDFGPLTLEGTKLWVDVPTTCSLRQNGGRFPEMANPSQFPEGIPYIFPGQGGTLTSELTCRSAIDPDLIGAITGVRLLIPDEKLETKTSTTVQIPEGGGLSSTYYGFGIAASSFFGQGVSPTSFLVGELNPVEGAIGSKKLQRGGIVHYEFGWNPALAFNGCTWTPGTSKGVGFAIKKNGTVVAAAIYEDDPRASISNLKEAVDTVPPFMYGTASFAAGDELTAEFRGCLPSNAQLRIMFPL